MNSQRIIKWPTLLNRLVKKKVLFTTKDSESIEYLLLILVIIVFGTTAQALRKLFTSRSFRSCQQNAPAFTQTVPLQRLY